MSNMPLNVLLADDDLDDCAFFREALNELDIEIKLTTVNDGVQLISLLNSNIETLPDALYLDLNMPCKNGFECLVEIKQNPTLKQLPIIIFSTSLDTDVANRLHEHGAHYYIRKPAEFQNLKKIISKSLDYISLSTPTKENFIIQI